jgi:hypothetical protein
MNRFYSFFFLVCFLSCTGVKEYHVSVVGSDSNNGSEQAPFQTIGKAARTAQPGDTITVHAGTYREWIDPPCGGESNELRIVYRAAAGELVEIKGSEVVTGWEHSPDSIWKITLPNSFFGNFNPYKELIGGDWFGSCGRIHHLGEVFLNGKSLYEKETLEKVVHPEALDTALDQEGAAYTWYCESDDETTTIWANFHTFDPNRELTEISTRPTCFWPVAQGINYLTISGFHFSQAATQWGAPTAEQIGMVATHWNKGWIIENNVISDSKCSGITLGKERGSGHNVWLAETNISGSLHYIETTFRAIRNGWSKENIGAHIVRNNVIFNCEQTGICGSMGAAFSIIEDNDIHHIWVKRLFTGAEIAGIKFHAAIDAQICRNRIKNTGRGLWLDWMTQGTRVSQNLFYDNSIEDLFVEVNHGPYLVDNNIFSSRLNVRDLSQGGAFVHNLLLGKVLFEGESSRHTPYHLPHETDIAGLATIKGGDDHYLNNIFAPQIPPNADKILGSYGLADYDSAIFPVTIDGNVYYNSAIPFAKEQNKVVLPAFRPDAALEETGNEVYLSLTLEALTGLQTEPVTTERLGKVKYPRQRYEQPDGTPITIDTDYFGCKRGINPTAGPFEDVKDGRVRLKVW